MGRQHTIVTLLALSLFAAGPEFVRGQFVSYDGVAFPEDFEKAWVRQFTPLPAQRWVDNGCFVQAPVVLPCPPECHTQDYYLREIPDHAGTHSWFLESVLITDGPPVFGAVAPAAMVASGFSGVLYHFTIGDERVQLKRGSEFPLVFADIQPGVAHRFRLELRNTPPTGTYRFTIDGIVIDEGMAEAYYPASDSSITFGARAAVVDNVTRWCSIRFGRIPDPGSGDMNSDGVVDLGDLFFMDECITDTGPDQPTRAGCLWADIDADGDVDLLDFAEFQVLFDAPGK